MVDGEGVRDDELIKALGQRGMRISREDSVRSERRDAPSAAGPHDISRLADRAARLDEIVHDEDILACWITFFDRDGPLVTLSADFFADDLHPIFEYLLESFCGAVIGEGDHGIVRYVRQVHRRVELRIHIEGIEEEALDEGVDIEGVDGGLARAARRQVREEISKVGCRRDLAFLGDALHRPDWEVRHDHSDLVGVVVEDTADDGIVWEEIFRTGEVTDIGDTLTLDFFFHIFDEEIGPAVGKGLESDGRTLYLVGLAGDDLVSERIKIWVSDDSLHSGEK